VRGPAETSLRYADDLDYPTAMGPDAHRFEAEPGTVVYLPRGTWHQTRVTGDTPSIAIVFSYRVRTAAQLFASHVRAFLHASAAWRQPAHGGWDRIRAAWEATPSGWRAGDVRFELPAEVGSSWQFAPPPGTALGWRDGALTVTTDGETETIALDETLAPVAEALRWIATRNAAFTTDELCHAMRPQGIAAHWIVELVGLLATRELVVRAQRGSR
jgi:hypothetical protein